MRVFSANAGVRCRGYSLLLERAISDFGGEEAFAMAAVRLKEHYGITVPVSSVRKVTTYHAGEMRKTEGYNRKVLVKPQELVLVETDGSMIPITQKQSSPEGTEKPDGRRHKEHF